MQKKLMVGMLAATALSWLVAGAVFAAPSMNPQSHRLPHTLGKPPPISASVIGLAPLMTATLTTTETLIPTVLPTSTVVPRSTLSPGNEKIAKAISDFFGVGLDAVSTIHDGEPGWGQVFFVFMLAQTTGKSPEEILAMPQDGEGWGQIFMGLGLKPGNHGKNLGAAVSGKTDPNSTPTTAPGGLAPINNNMRGINTDCKGNSDNNGKGNPCSQPGSTPLTPTNPNSNNSGRGNENSNNNGNGNSKGKGGK